MVKSRRERFIFIHIQKTAGASIREDLLAQVADAEKVCGTHDGAREIIREVGRDEWRSCFTFAFVRNPWERLVSWWTMIDRRRPRVPLYKYSPLARPRLKLWRYALRNARTFDEFVTDCVATVVDHDGVKSFARPQLDYLIDADGRECVDYVGRFERLDEHYGEIRDRLGLARRRLPHIRHGSSHPHYSLFYSDRTRDIVADRFAADIARFGYGFDDRR